MTIIELGALGEFVGAIAVVVTLVYLAMQIRQNTRAMEEAMLVRAAESEHIGPILTKLSSVGYPEDVSSLDHLSTSERGRFRQWQIAQQTHWDNMFYQYQQGFLDEEYYRDSFRERVRRLAPIWKALGVTGSRRSFSEEMERIIQDSASGTFSKPD